MLESERPAFPHDNPGGARSPGISQRDFAALLAMQGMLAAGEGRSAAAIADAAYQIAGAMAKESRVIPNTESD